MPDRVVMPERPPPLRAVLVDDEPAAAGWLAALLARHPHVEVVGTAEDADAAEGLIGRLRPDVVFVDVQMPRRSGLTVLDRLGPETRGVVVTAHEEFAVDAFDTAAVDYLVKPVTADRLDRTLARLAGAGPRGGGTMDEAGDAVVSGTAADNDKLWLAFGGETTVVDPEQILWIEAEENYSRVCCSGQPPLLVRRTLTEWEKLLSEESFLRVSRSLILRLDRIVRIRWRAKGGTQLELAGAEGLLTLGRPATRRLKERLDREG